MEKRKELNRKKAMLKEILGNVTELDRDSIIFASILSKSSENTLEQIEDQELAFHIKLVEARYREKIDRLALEFSQEDLKELLLAEKDPLSFRGFNLITKGVYRLLLGLLEVEETDSLADLQVSSLSDLEYILENPVYGKINIYDYNLQKILSYRMINNILKGDINIIEKNFLEEGLDRKYNKILAPIRLRDKVSDRQKDEINRLYPELGRIATVSSSWADILTVLDYLEEDGKLVVLTTEMAGYARNERNIRKYFVENGLIETVIKLPKNILKGLTVVTNIMVISRNNKKVNFVDASKIYSKLSRLERDLSEENIEEILGLVGWETEKSTRISNEEIDRHDFLLDPRVYVDKISFVNGIKLGDVGRINRGSTITNKELERYRSKEKTGYRFLNLADIQDGRIEDTAIYLKSNLVEANEKLGNASRLRPGQLVLSRTGRPIRLALVEDIGDEVWFYSGNIYAIDLDRQLYNPYYLKAFLETEIGQEILDRLSNGAAIPNISMGGLNDMVLPGTEIEKQNAVEKIYRAYEEELRQKEEEIREIENRREKELDKLLSGKELGLCN